MMVILIQKAPKLSHSVSLLHKVDKFDKFNQLMGWRLNLTIVYHKIAFHNETGHLSGLESR